MKTLKQLEEEIRQLAYDMKRVAGSTGMIWITGCRPKEWLCPDILANIGYTGISQFRGAAEEKPRRRKSTNGSPGKGPKTRGQTRSEV